MQVSTLIQSAEISAVITRADGTVEDLGVIDSYKKQPDKGENQGKGATDGDRRN